MAKTIWYISKYAIAPPYGNATRQFYFSKYFAIKGYNTILMTSYSSGIKNIEPNIFDQYFKYDVIDGVHHYLLRGPLISLGFSFKRILSWVKYEWYVFKLGNDIVKKQKPDAIIVSSLSLLTIINGIYFKWKFGCKFILEIRDIWPLTLIEIGSYSRYNPIILFLGFIEQLGYKYADNIIGLMPNLILHIPQKYKNKVHHIPQGIELNPYRKSDFSDTTLGIIGKINQSNFNIIYTGSIGQVNDVEKMIEILIECYKINQRILFHIVGDGTQKKNLMEKYKNNKNIIFHNAIPKSDVPFLLSHFEANIIHVSPHNIYRYGISPNKLNEYLLSSNPTILIYDGYKSTIEESDGGFVISSLNFENIVTSILNISNMNVATLKQKGKNGREYALKNLDYSILSEKYLKIIFPSS
ncbi:MAG: glycosyltransferase family 4 protein [Saprospiraceae bacterium]|nr:glycosyltransferase family 4 protein [Saprospiraceae bacterium]